MTVSDAAIAQAFREYDEGDIVQLRMILARARELDAKPEQVHTCSYYCDRPGCLKAQRDELRDRLEATPPAQAAEAVERVARAIYECEAVDTLGDFPWNHLVGSGAFPDTLTKYRRMARAAIAAMQESAK